jgi:cytoskeletal protein RodZ
MASNKSKNNSEQKTPSSQKPEAITPGEIFKKARLAKKITHEQIAAYYKVPVKYFKNIEQNKYENNKMDVYVRGYLRMYASYLEVDYTTTLKQLKALGVESDYIEPPKSTTQQQTQREAVFTISTQELCRYGKYILFSILILSACIFVVNKLNTTTAKFSETFELNHVDSLISLKKTKKHHWISNTSQRSLKQINQAKPQANLETNLNKVDA